MTDDLDWDAAEGPQAFTARYDGWCPVCHEPIQAGDPIRELPGSEYVHDECGNVPIRTAPRPEPEAVCPRCFLTSCDCNRPETT